MTKSENIKIIEKMKRKGLLITTIFFFLIVNSSYFWESKLGIFAIPVFFSIIIYFFILSVLLLTHVFFAFKEKFIDKQRVIAIVIMTFVFATSLLFPKGLINFSIFESEDLLIAQREGVANCTTILKLKANKKFVERDICFGINDICGNYIIKNDTIFFKNASQGRNENEFYEFAVIKRRETNSNYWEEIIRYRNHSDTIGVELLITKNELIK